MAQARTIVIGLDSFDLRLVEQWTAAGELPCLKQLLATCPTVVLSTPSRVLQGTVWPSLLTGLSPGRHGSYFQSQLRNGTYALMDKFADRRVKRFYQHLGDRGLRCGIVDIPTDRPLRSMRGVQVVEWSPEFTYWHYATVPSSFARQIRCEIGENPMTTHWDSGDSQESHRKLCISLDTSARMKAQLGSYLIGRRDLDLVFCVFGEAHKAGHWLWKYHDETHPDHEVAPAALKDGLRNSYRQLDRAVSQMTERVSCEDNLIIFSDHGMQAAYRGDHLVDSILDKTGMRICDAPKSVPHPVSSTATPALRQARQMFRNGKLAIKRRLPELALAALDRNKNAFPGMDWSRTRAFSLPTDRNSHIRVNLRGREPQGIVDPGKAYEVVLDELEGVFRSLINPLTGHAAVEEVFRVRREFPGEYADDFPDLAILWSAEAAIDAVSSPRLGEIRQRIREQRSGNHRAEGFLLARGPAFKQGAGRYQGDILQIAPTLLHLHGVPIPEHYAMSPLEVILK